MKSIKKLSTFAIKSNQMNSVKGGGSWGVVRPRTGGSRPVRPTTYIIRF